MLQGMAPQQEPVGARRILLLVGDSDIARWPSELLPQWSESALPPTVSGHSGATLKEIIPHIETALDTIDTAIDTIILVVCAGENDIGNGLSRDDTLTAFDELVNVFFGSNAKSLLVRIDGSSFSARNLNPGLIMMHRHESSTSNYHEHFSEPVPNMLAPTTFTLSIA